MRPHLVILVCALVASACGRTIPSEAPLTSAPSAPLPLEAECVVGVPADFAVEPRNGNAYMSWASSAPAHAYEVEIDRVDSGALVTRETVSGVRWEWGAPGLGQGPYRARVRAVADCGRSGWSPWDRFILNRHGGSGTPPAPPAVPPVPLPPAAPLLSCGTLKGHYVADLLGTSFEKGDPPVFAPLSLPAGTYRVDIETNDAGHAPGVDVGQTEEVVTLWGVGTTHDIPEAAPRQVTTFTATLPMLAQIVVEAGPHSIHGVCVAFTRS